MQILSGMEPNIVVNTGTPHGQRIEDAPFEIVERKGLGHPDTLCDGVAEALSVAVARRYREETGALLHFNLDKVLLAAGQVERGFGGGRIVRPMTLYVGDRVTTRLDGRDLGVGELVEETARSWFARTLPALDVENGLRVTPVFGAGSSELSRIFGGSEARANDTSAAVGYAPFTPLERMVLAFEEWLNGTAFKERHPETGEDVKVMAIRSDDRVDVTVAMPFLARRVPDAAAHGAIRAAVVDEALSRARALLPAGLEVSLTLNALDDLSRGSNGVYLTLSGTSAEHGDSGEVGRGNRASGLISFLRPSGAEAAAGKNPFSHAGKIYSVLAFKLAAGIREEVEGVTHVTVWLASRIGAPIREPRLCAVDIVPRPGAGGAMFERAVADLVAGRLARLDDFCLELEAGRYPVC